MRGSDLKDRRLAAFMTQYDMAQKIGVTIDTIRRWERMGERELPFLAIRKINAAKVKATHPDFVLPPDAIDARPDLKLFGQYFPSHKSWALGPEHPRHLVPHLKPAEGPYPWSILEHPDYLAALEASRAPKPARPLSPEQEATNRLYEKYLSEHDNDT